MINRNNNILYASRPHNAHLPEPQPPDVHDKHTRPPRTQTAPVSFNLSNENSTNACRAFSHRPRPLSTQTAKCVMQRSRPNNANMTQPKRQAFKNNATQPAPQTRTSLQTEGTSSPRTVCCASCTAPRPASQADKPECCKSMQHIQAPPRPTRPSPDRINNKCTKARHALHPSTRISLNHAHKNLQIVCSAPPHNHHHAHLPRPKSQESKKNATPQLPTSPSQANIPPDVNKSMPPAPAQCSSAHTVPTE